MKPWPKNPPPTVHALKCDPLPFHDIREGSKRFEFRDKSDRQFIPGDYILLLEYVRDESGNGYTGEALLIYVSYVHDLDNYGFPNHVGMTIKVVK